MEQLHALCQLFQVLSLRWMIRLERVLPAPKSSTLAASPSFQLNGPL
jgi:hypothetical protein